MRIEKSSECFHGRLVGAPGRAFMDRLTLVKSNLKRPRPPVGVEPVQALRVTRSGLAVPVVDVGWEIRREDASEDITPLIQGDLGVATVLHAFNFPVGGDQADTNKTSRVDQSSGVEGARGAVMSAFTSG